MAKIGKEFVRFEQSNMEYEIMYSSDSGFFWADVSKMPSGMEEYFDSIVNSKEIDHAKRNEMGIREGHLRRTGYKKLIFGGTEAELKERVADFHRKFVKLATSESKVILYQFSYNSENNVMKNWHGGYSRNDDRFSLEFSYYIATRKDFGSDKLYRKCGSNFQISRHDIHSFKEIPWTQELEDFIHSFEKSFDQLVTKMRPFFENDGQIMELIGRNILAP
jgi:hypothetical protein